MTLKPGDGVTNSPIAQSCLSLTKEARTSRMLGRLLSRWTLCTLLRFGWLLVTALQTLSRERGCCYLTAAFTSTFGLVLLDPSRLPYLCSSFLCSATSLMPAVRTRALPFRWFQHHSWRGKSRRHTRVRSPWKHSLKEGAIAPPE